MYATTISTTSLTYKFAAPLPCRRAHYNKRLVCAAEKNEDRLKDIGSAATKQAQEVTNNVKQAVNENIDTTDLKRQLSGVAQTADTTGYGGPLFLPIFSRRREVWAGRLAMIGFPATIIWEALLPGHPGPLGQVAHFTGLPAHQVGILFGLVLLHGALGLFPSSFTFDPANQRDVLKRPPGPPFRPMDPVKQPMDILGVSRWGFTKKNEVFNGRLCMLGFLAACGNEIATHGLGTIGQVASLYTNAPITEGLYSSGLVFLGAWTLIAGSLAFLSGNGVGQTQGDNDIY